MTGLPKQAPRAPGRIGADDAGGGIPDGPQVGIFWGLRRGDGDRTIMAAGVALARAEPYGDCLTYPGGHYEVWEAWRRLPVAELRRRRLPPALRAHEYEAVPCGRIVYVTGAHRFIVYADCKLQAPALIARITRLFDLGEADVEVRSDAHYRTPSGA